MIEDKLENMFVNNSEKTSIDKVLAKEDIKAIRDILKKEILDRSDMLEVLDFLVSAEAKLVNYGEWERYIILKFFVWIREFVKCAELIFDTESDLDKYAYALKKENKESDITDEDKKEENENVLDDDLRLMFIQCKRISSHNIKFLVDLYLNIARTSLSLHGSGFLEVLKNKFEVTYPYAMLQSPQDKNIMGFKK